MTVLQFPASAERRQHAGCYIHWTIQTHVSSAAIESRCKQVQRHGIHLKYEPCRVSLKHSLFRVMKYVVNLNACIPVQENTQDIIIYPLAYRSTRLIGRGCGNDLQSMQLSSSLTS